MTISGGLVGGERSARGEVRKPTATTRRRVRVWFGNHVVIDRTGELPEIAHYYLGMKRRYASLLVTVEPISETTSLSAARNPAKP
jgi:hypothetical protein